MKIKKIYVQNFKGLYEKRIIDINNNVSLLMGPNGFGKTTIFDILELCLTGIIHRTVEKDGITNHFKDYSKPFYQNTVEQDVIVKVWLSKLVDGKEENKIIIKHLPKNHDGRVDSTSRRNKPKDFDLLGTYSENPEDFDKEEFNKNNARVLTQIEIDQFFGFETNGYEIRDVYNLFNYLQQEETTFFLKKSEGERKSSLAFLFQTSKQENELKEISATVSRLKDIQKKLEEKISIIKDYNVTDIVDYEPLFPESNFEFDKRDIFNSKNLDESKESMRSINKEIDDIIYFLRTFSLEDYNNKLNVELLDSKIKDKELLDFYTLKKIINENYNSIKRKIDLLNDDEKLEGFIVKKLSKDYLEYEVQYNKSLKYKSFIDQSDMEERLRILPSFVKEIMPDNLDNFQILLDSRKLALETAKELDLTLKEIMKSRKNLYRELEKMSSDVLGNGICPYCGEDWGNHEELLEAYKKREINLNKLLTNQSQHIIKIEGELKETYIEPIIGYMKDYLKKHEQVELKILNKLKDFHKKDLDFSEIEEYEFSLAIPWNKPQGYQDLQHDLAKMKNQIESKLPVSSDIFMMMKKLSYISFDSSMEQLHHIIPEDSLEKFIIPNTNEIINRSDQSGFRRDLIQFIEGYKNKYKYDYEKAKDEKNIFKIYFNNNEEKLKEFQTSKLDKKKLYIKYLFSMKESNLLDSYQEKLQKLNKVTSKIEKEKQKYHSLIVTHKRVMVENIKLPFYIYTAKILQNYQQGMGIFLSTSGPNDSIRFLTDTTSDHDAIHHLSSGQLAVVSLAFTLAINKTYNIADNLKFLAIDDPVQEMDSLNIHSFVELIRHEFLEDYQLIFSTHNDMNALYMKYKFGKLTKKDISLINVQDEFFS